MTNRYSLIDGIMMPDPEGEYVLYSDFKNMKDSRDKLNSDLGWARDAAREEYERTRHNEWN